MTTKPDRDHDEIRGEIERLLGEAREIDCRKNTAIMATSRWWDRAESVFLRSVASVPDASNLGRRFESIVVSRKKFGRVFEKVATAVADPSLVADLRAALNLASILLVELDEILIGTGPSPNLSSTQLHVWVWNDRTASLWAGKHFQDSVSVAATRVDEELQAKTQLDLSGKQLVTESFSTKPPANGKRRLRVTPRSKTGTQRWTSAQEGGMHLGLAVAQYLRNRVAHESGTRPGSETMEETEALHALVVISAFARLVETADVQHGRGASRTRATYRFPKQ